MDVKSTGLLPGHAPLSGMANLLRVLRVNKRPAAARVLQFATARVFGVEVGAPGYLQFMRIEEEGREVQF